MWAMVPIAALLMIMLLMCLACLCYRVQCGHLMQCLISCATRLCKPTRPASGLLVITREQRNQLDVAFDFVECKQFVTESLENNYRDALCSLSDCIDPTSPELIYEPQVTLRASKHWFACLRRQRRTSPRIESKHTDEEEEEESEEEIIDTRQINCLQNENKHANSLESQDLGRGETGKRNNFYIKHHKWIEGNSEDNNVVKFNQPTDVIAYSAGCDPCLAAYHLILQNKNNDSAKNKQFLTYRSYICLNNNPVMLVAILRCKSNLAHNAKTRLLLSYLTRLKHPNVAEFVGFLTACYDDDEKIKSQTKLDLSPRCECQEETCEDCKQRKMKLKYISKLARFRQTHDESEESYLGDTEGWHYFAIWRRYTRGSLADVIKQKSPIKLNWLIKLSIMADIIQGLRYLHESKLIHSHGWLNSRNCLITSRWQLKLCDFGMSELLSCVTKTESRSTECVELRAQRSKLELLWIAPEHLRQSIPTTGSPSGDVYSFAMIVYEMLSELEHPYASYQDRFELNQIIDFLRYGCQRSHDLLVPFRPELMVLPTQVEGQKIDAVVNLMTQCWREEADKRPSLDQIDLIINNISGLRESDIVQRMIIKLDAYTQSMEELVRQRTKELEAEKNRSEELLYKVFPKPVADSLKTGTFVKPKKFENVTVFFSDIVGFTTIASYSEPLEVIDLLNELFTHFDNILKNHDAFKVETIGDAYMVVSGLPTRNEDHAEQIASVSLEMLHFCETFKIKHMPSIPLQIRIGMHTGSVVSGVVGFSNPRYCLFGDTVNIAARLESTGLPNTIHVSHSSERKLAESGRFVLRYRGEIVLRGRGKFPTFWLIGRTGQSDETDTEGGCLLTVPDESEQSHGLTDEAIAFATAGFRQQDL